MNKFHITSINEAHCVRIFAIIIFSLLLSEGPCLANDGKNAGDLISEMETISNRIVTTKKSEAESLQVEYNEIQTKFISLGDVSVAAVKNRLKNKENPYFRRELTFILGEISGEEADRTLLHLLCFDTTPAVGETALIQLIHRTEKSGPLSFTVQVEELGTLIRVVREAPVGHANDVILLLGRCAKNPIDIRLTPIMERFVKEIHYNGELPITGSYLSPKVCLLNGFLLTFKSMGEIVWKPLHETYDRSIENKDEEAAKWLAIASGYAGDPSVAELLKAVVLSDSDCNVRCVAIRAYASSAKENAIPVLKSIESDTTPSEYSDRPSWGRPLYIIGDTAKECLYEIENKL